MNQDVAKTFCPLPWTHLSAHLDSTMRICCNTDGPGFVLDDSGNHFQLKDVTSVNEYFNLKYYKEIRRQMLQGERPEQCRKCYQVEDHGGMSVRQGYLANYKDNEVLKANVQATCSETGAVDVKVQSLDFSLSNKCNLKCIMCSPAASYAIKGDYDHLGMEYNKSFTEGARRNWEELSHLDHLIEQIGPDLREFLTTGGEPFLSKQHQQVLEKLVKNNHSSHVDLSYHTNCTVRNPALMELWKSFRSVNVHFSIDAFGDLNEYIRFNTHWDDVCDNVKEIMAHPKVRCEVHSTIQSLNIFGLPALYEWIDGIGGKMPKLPYHIWMDQPSWLRLDVLPRELLQEAELKLNNYFSKTIVPPERRWLAKMSLSYVQRAIAENSSDVNLKEFRGRIRDFEKIRGTQSIEAIVPEFRELFKGH